MSATSTSKLSRTVDFRLNLLNDRPFFGPHTAMDTLWDLFGPDNRPVEYLMCSQLRERLGPPEQPKKVDNYHGVPCDDAGMIDWYIQAEYENGVRIGLVLNKHD